MTTNTIHSDHSSVYPGMYERLWSEMELSYELHKKNAKVITPAVYIQQLTDHYRIEMAIPGYEKENFSIHTNGRVLSISALNKKCSGKTETDPGLEKAGCECITRNMVLPEDADTEFATAAYANGILSICLFTANQPVDNRSGEIIVY